MFFAKKAQEVDSWAFFMLKKSLKFGVFHKMQKTFKKVEKRC